MSVSDPIADFLTGVRNAIRAKRRKVDVPATRFKTEIARVLLRERYINNFKVIEDSRQGVLRVYLKYGPGNEKIISGLVRVSTPGRRVYVGHQEIPSILGGMGVAVLSTPRGVVTELRRFFYDTAWSAHPMALASLTKLVPATQILFGSDYPYRTGEDHVKGLMEYGFTAADLQAIERENARACDTHRAGHFSSSGIGFSGTSFEWKPLVSSFIRSMGRAWSIARSRSEADSPSASGSPIRHALRLAKRRSAERRAV